MPFREVEWIVVGPKLLQTCEPLVIQNAPEVKVVPIKVLQMSISTKHCLPKLFYSDSYRLDKVVSDSTKMVA